VRFDERRRLREKRLIFLKKEVNDMALFRDFSTFGLAPHIMCDSSFKAFLISSIGISWYSFSVRSVMIHASFSRRRLIFLEKEGILKG